MIGPMGPHMPMPDAGPMWWWMVVASLAWIIPLAVVAWLILTATRREDRARPERILRERFARGEIDQTEYDARRRALA